MTAEREKKLSRKAAKAVAPGGGDVLLSTVAGEASGTGSEAVPPPEALPVVAAAAAEKDPSLVAGTGRKRAALEAEAAADSNARKPKKAPALEVMPKHATKGVYASLFSSSVARPEKETYCCRSTSARGVHLT